MLWLFIWMIGCCVGSFVNVVCYRLEKKQSFIFGRSYCESCGKSLYWYDLIPIISFILLKGRCRFCHQRLSSLHLLIEGLSGFLFVLCIFRYGLSLIGIIVYLILEVLLVIALIDLKTMMIYDITIIALVILGIIYRYITGFYCKMIIVDTFFIGSIMFLINKVYHDAFGFGDIELMIVSGLMLGCLYNFIAFSLGVMFACIYSLVLMKQGKSDLKSKIPFGPFLALGIALSLFYGYLIIDFYLRLVIF